MLQQNNCRTWVKELMVSNSQINSASCCAFKMLLLEKLVNLWLFREDWDFLAHSVDYDCTQIGIVIITGLQTRG